MDKDDEQLLGRTTVVVPEDFQQLFGSGPPYPHQRDQLLDLLLPWNSSQNFSETQTRRPLRVKVKAGE